jgi:hypothetical protein
MKRFERELAKAEKLATEHRGSYYRWERGTDMKILKRSNRVYDTARFGQPEIRLRHRPARGKKSPSYLLRCGCCDQRLEIHYAEDGLEIGGVNGTLEDWREILLPLLLIERKGARFVDVSRKPKGAAKKAA